MAQITPRGYTIPDGTDPISAGDDLLRENFTQLDEEVTELFDRLQSGVVFFESGTYAPQAGTTVAVTFQRAFSSPPAVVLGTIGNPVGSYFFTIRSGGISSTGFTARCYNGSTAQQTLGADWECSWIALPRNVAA